MQKDSFIYVFISNFFCVSIKARKFYIRRNNSKVNCIEAGRIVITRFRKDFPFCLGRESKQNSLFHKIYLKKRTYAHNVLSRPCLYVLYVWLGFECVLKSSNFSENSEKKLFWPSRISETPPAGFWSVQKLNPAIVEWSYAVVLIIS